VKNGRSANVIVLASHSIVNVRWIFLTHFYRKKVA